MRHVVVSAKRVLCWALPVVVLVAFGNSSGPRAELSLATTAGNYTPSSLAATPYDSSVSLTWQENGPYGSTGDEMAEMPSFGPAVPNGVTFSVLRSTANGGPYSTVASGLANTAYTDTGLTNGTAYYYVATATVNGVSSAYSNQASATPEPAPTVPTGVRATGGSTQVALSWNASSNSPSSYSVLRSTSASGPYSQVATPGSTSCTDTGLSAGATYYYEIVSVNQYGQSAPSSAVSGLTLPAAPSNAVATAGDTEVLLSWSAAASATSYTIARSLTSGGSPVATFTVTNTSFTDSGLADGAAYYYTVIATNATGSGPAASCQATPSGSTPSSGGGLTAEYTNQVPAFVTRIDASVDPSVIQEPPAAILSGLGHLSGWGCRWSGYVAPPSTGNYSFSAQGDCSMISVTVNGQSVYHFNGLVEIGPDNPHSVPITLTKGQTYTIVYTYSSNLDGGADPTTLQWELPGNTAYTTIPTTYLSPALSNVSPPANTAAAWNNSEGSVIWSQSGATIAGFNVYRGSSVGGENYGSPVNNALYTTPTSQGGSSYDFMDSSAPMYPLYFTVQTAFNNPVTGDHTLSSPSADAPAVPVHLASVSLREDTILGSPGSTVGSVTMSAPWPSAQTVNLSATDAAITVPQNVTVSANSTATSFSVSGNTQSASLTATIYASLGAWTQQAAVSVLNASISIAQPTASSGAGGVWISWQANQTVNGTTIPLDDDVFGTYVAGFRIDRSVNGGAFASITSGDTQAFTFFDNSTSPSSSYTYRVTLECSDGSQLAQSAISVTVSGQSSPNIIWKSPPTSPQSGVIELYANNPDLSQQGYTAYLDGNDIGVASALGDSGGSLSTIELDIDTSEFTSGQHTLVLASNLNASNLFSSAPLQISFSNSGVAGSSDGLCEPEEGELYEYSRQMSNAGWYTLSLTDSNGTTVRTWSGYGTSERVSWDGTDGAGNTLADGTYTLSDSGSGGGGGGGDGVVQITKTAGDPTFLAVITIQPNWYPEVAWSLASKVRSTLANMHGQFGFSYAVAVVSNWANPSKATMKTLKRWLMSSVRWLYYQGHELMFKDNSGGFSNGGLEFSRKCFVTDFALGSSYRFINMTKLSSERKYQFAFLDVCASAGWNPATPNDEYGTEMTAAPISKWADTLNVDYADDETGCFIAVNGEGGLGAEHGVGYGSFAAWADWRLNFWDTLGPRTPEPADAIQSATASVAGEPQWNPSLFSNWLQQFKVIWFGSYNIWH